MNTSISSQFTNTQTYKTYAKFKSKEEFNNHFEQIMLMHKKKFTKSEYIAINKLRKFAFSESSLDTIGVAWCKGQTCVAATHKERAIYDVKDSLIATFGISRSTFDRALKVAVEIGLVTVINQFDTKKGSRRIHNVYVFNRLEEVRPENYILQKHRKVVSMEEIKEQRTIKTSVSRKELMPKTVRIVSEKNTIDATKLIKIDETITLLLELPKLRDITYPMKSASKKLDIKPSEKDMTEYDRFKKYATQFIEPTLVYKMYGAWKINISSLKAEKPPYEVLERAFKAAISGIKSKQYSKRPVLNKVGYFVGVLDNIVDKWIYESRFITLLELEENEPSYPFEPVKEAY